MEFYYNGAWRMDWGFGNPNTTAALIACLMMAGWAIACVSRRGFWFALPVFTALGWCLVQTYSRGGMLALLVGGAVLLIGAPRPWPRSRWIAALIAVWVLGFFIIYAKAGARYSQGLFSDDQSIMSRLVIWKHFPEMLAAAPWGWGWGKAGDSYTQWFQPCEESLNYLNLINSHLTWMAEGGWVFSCLYLWSWLAIFWLCWPAPNGDLRAVPLSVWIAFGVSGCFSHVAASVWLWIVPLIFLGWALRERLSFNRWPAPAGLGWGALAFACIVASLVVVGFTHAEVPIRMMDHAVAVGRGADASVIFVDRSVMGKLYGHALRKYLDKNPILLSRSTFILTESPHDTVPANVQQIVISGRMIRDSNIAASLNHADHIILINPGCFPEEAEWGPGIAPKTAVYFGEYCECPSRASWAAYPQVKSLLIQGAGNFIPAWPRAVWGPTGI
jgi:hypothetical protein